MLNATARPCRLNGAVVCLALGRRREGPRRGGFTLIELLIVIGIIGVLVAIALVVAKAATNGGKEGSTLNTIRTLDTVLTEYIADRGAPPQIYEYKDPNTSAIWRFPLVDATPVAAGGNPVGPTTSSLGRFLGEATQVPGVDAMIKGLDSRLVRPVVLDPNGGGSPIMSVEVLDGWGRPIRFVHPQFDGGYGSYWNPVPPPGALVSTRDVIGPITLQLGGARQQAYFRRSYRPDANAPGDADEGVCVGKRPYFYSAGSDGDPGTRNDNVYSTRPTFPTETAKFSQ
jgi:prepilin-type N-terminal cleavage/methylation domain-containing protein